MVADMVTDTTNGHHHEHESSSERLPVTLLCGFLGAGKTTLLKHILETKHSETDGSFRCAILVNDMASLNIDKSLIQQSALVKTDEVIAMQNGCFCCTLQSDLVDQLKELCAKKIFDYMLIEASGVSEPSNIAPLFDPCEDEHDHKDSHEGPELGEMARLDTCVTVVDAAEFHRNLESITKYENGEMEGTITELMMEQVQYSNVIVLNKQDLVSEDQEQDILDRLALINPNANVVKSSHGKIDVMDILDTHRFDRKEIGVDSVMFKAMKAEPEPEEPEPACCTKSVNEGKVKCCKKKARKIFDTGLSQVLLGVVPTNERQKQLTRHEKRFGITSFVYRARRPFHPGRLHTMMMDPYFMCPEEKNKNIEVLQKTASTKQQKRVEFMGEVLRSKGFIWIASTPSIMGGWQQAGNILRISAEGPWMCDTRETWEGTPEASEVLKDMTQENGETYPYEDRRQELVFIGIGLKHEVIQKTLDQCLLNDVEMKMHPEQWEQVMADEDRIRLTLEEKPRLVPGQVREEFWGITLSEELKELYWFPPKDYDDEDEDGEEDQSDEVDDEKTEEDEEEEEEKEEPKGLAEHKLHLTQACLGRQPKDGERNLIEATVKRNGLRKRTCISALRTGTSESQHIDLMFSDVVKFSLVEGSGPVCLSGTQISTMMEAEWEEDMEDEEEEENIMNVSKKIKNKAEVIEMDQQMKKILKKAKKRPAVEDDTEVIKKKMKKANMENTQKKMKKVDIEVAKKKMKKVDLEVAQKKMKKADIGEMKKNKKKKKGSKKARNVQQG